MQRLAGRKQRGHNIDGAILFLRFAAAHSFHQLLLTEPFFNNALMGSYGRFFVKIFRRFAAIT
jgi:hypothetical protein